MNKKIFKSPLIGISSTLLTVESGCFIGYERSVVLHNYVGAIERVGGVPVILPIVKDRSLIERQMEGVDGLLLSGGYDISPLHYQEEPQQGLEALCDERDVYEIELAQHAYRSKKPIFGVCRGLQLLNVAFGGTLYQDIHLAFPRAIQHASKARPHEATHTVSVVSNSLLQRIVGKKTLLTNSFHHQAIKQLAPLFLVNAETKDGMIEGIEGREDSFILGVQWHPEMMIESDPEMLKLFQAFVEAARHWKGEEDGEQ